MNNKQELTIRISGEAGQGTQTIGLALCKLWRNAGAHVFAHQDFMSRIRGGNNYFELRVSCDPIFTLRRPMDIIVALDKASVALHKKDVASGGCLLTDRAKLKVDDREPFLLDVAFYEMAQTLGGSDLYVNAAACGALTALTGLAFDDIEAVLKDAFRDKGQEVVEKNIAVARAGFDRLKDGRRIEGPSRKPGPVRLLMNGHEAVTLAAIKAGCKFYSAYPMSPSTSLLENMAQHARDFNIVVEQAEDEIAAVNMVIGASYAGVRSMCGTSGGGFALMVEGLSLAGMTETPLVAVDAQRPGPATGFPTRTEQADLDFLIHAGHGEFARVVYAPGTVEEAFYVTQRAFNIAEKYQVPVLILTDQHLADSLRTLDGLDLDREPVKRFFISQEDSKGVVDYKRYRLTDSGVSPLAVPSWIEGVVYADSDEHTEEGHITEDASVRVKMVEKRFTKKMALLSKEAVPPTCERSAGADILLVGFGSTYGVLKETCDRLAAGKKKAGFVHFSQVWPFPSEQALSAFQGAKRVWTVENNAGGQLAKLIRRETGLKPEGSILKFDGRPFSLDELLERLKEVI